jgi:hypothetical protein
MYEDAGISAAKADWANPANTAKAMRDVFIYSSMGPDARVEATAPVRLFFGGILAKWRQIALLLMQISDFAFSLSPLLSYKHSWSGIICGLQPYSGQAHRAAFDRTDMLLTSTCFVGQMHRARRGSTLFWSQDP